MLNKLRSAVEHAHSEEYEGVKQEKGLRMLVFGKPGSGKVRERGFSQVLYLAYILYIVQSGT